MLLVGVLGLASGLIASTPTSATGTCDPAGTPFGGGTGTEGDPYLVCSPTHLDNVRDELTKSFVQTANIDLDVAPYNTGDGWAPIAVGAPGVFSGNFDGGGYEISNLFINRPVTELNGLFGIVQQGEIRNLSLTDVSVTGNGNTGGAIGTLGAYVSGTTTVSDISMTGAITGTYFTGGVSAMLR